MADIDLERKRGGGLGWLWGLLAALALVLIVWWVWPDGGVDVADRGIETVEPAAPASTPGPVAEEAGVTVGAILGSPDDYVGQRFPPGDVRVAEVPTDRGFWIEDQGQRLFAVIVDRPQEEPVDIDPGQMIRIEGGMLRDASFLAEMPGAPLDQETRATAEQQEVFLVVDEGRVSVVESEEPQPAAGPATTVPNR